MTDISVFSRAFQAENRSWDLTPPGGAFDLGGTLSVAAFDATTMYPNGYLPSGTILAKITASGLWGPYLDAAGDGRTAAIGILSASVQMTSLSGALVKVGCNAIVHGKVSVAKLPFVVANQPLGGYIDANGQANLPLIYFAA